MNLVERCTVVFSGSTKYHSYELVDLMFFFLVLLLFVQGVLSNNNIVAVKQLHMESPQVTDEFINEIVLITNLQHRNLVHLKGYSLNGKEMLLVYDYIDNYDLDKFLHGELSFEQKSLPA